MKLNYLRNKLKSSKLDDFTFFYFLEFSQYLFVYFVLSIIGLRFVYRIEHLILEYINVDEPNKHTNLRKIVEIIVMLAINIIIYIFILLIGKSLPSIANYIYPNMATNTIVSFIEDFIILFILVLGDERLEYHISTLRE
jgi:hypothetical protein